MTSYRDDVLAHLDARKFASAVGIVLGKKVGADEYRFLCPFHGDHEPSANLNVRTGLWKCQACGVGGSPIDFYMLQHPGASAFKDALTFLGELAGVERPTHTNGASGAASPAPSKLTEEAVTGWHEAALRNARLMRWFEEKRGYSRETVERYQLGWNGERVMIPIRDPAGKLVNVRKYKRDSTAEQGKMLPFASSMGPDATTRLFPHLDPMPDEVLLVEGEWDAMIGQQNGIENALTMTIGAGNWNPVWTPLFRDRRVCIAYDNDEAGRKGAIRVAAILSSAAQGTNVTVLQIPNLPEKGDLTDFYVEQGRTSEELRALILDASPYISAPAAIDEPEARRVQLHEASHASLRGVRLELPILMSGKAMTPYTVPYEMRVTCDMSNKRYCSVCPMQEVAGKRDVVLSPADPAVLSLINVTGAQQMTAIRELAKAVPQCTRPQVEVISSINVEELRLIPELDAAADTGGDVEYVARQGFFLGHGLLPNRSYAVRGYSHPHPKNQQTVHLLSEAEPAQDNISAFAMSPELSKELQVFGAVKGDVAMRFTDLYNDFARNVHRIQGREDMQIAFDLVWHSVIGFHFNGEYVHRGWVEGMVIGDSGQAKSKYAESLLGHYGLGYRLPAEQTSMAGLIGGLEKMGDTWMLGWGAIPLNDKRLLIIDEAQGLATTTIEGMSDVRASGVAEITKIRTEKTSARCRLIWLANPVSGLTLAQHNQGVLAIKELFKKPEDIRRLDFALTVASGDVDAARLINVRHDNADAPRYRSDLCRSLVLWAWSRRADQVDFTPEATDLVLSTATRMGDTYHASIPLVEPADQRLKLARLAAAAAARVYSTDKTGERLIVREEHVAFVAEYLDRIYEAPSMAYLEYSEAMRHGEELTDEETAEVRDNILSWGMRDDALAFIRNASKFRKSELVDVVGWDDTYARGQLKMLASHRLIRPVRDGYIKSPAFIALLRGLTSADALPPDDPDAPF